MATECEVITSLDRFKKLYDITTHTCNIRCRFDYDSISQDPDKRWQAILKVWENNFGKLSNNVFVNPIFHIFNNRYYFTKYDFAITLSQEIENTIINDKEAFDAWSQSELFYQAFHRTLYHIFPQSAFEKYQVARGMMHVANGRDITQFAKKLQNRIKYIHNIDDFALQEKIYNDFVSTINSIIPQSSAWTDEQWINSEHVYHEVYKTYNIDFNNHFRNRDIIFDLLLYIKSPSIELLPDITQITADNYHVIDTVFRKQLESILIDIYNKALNENPPEKYGKLIVQNPSYATIARWADDKSHPQHRGAKKIIFDVLMKTNNQSTH